MKGTSDDSTSNGVARPVYKDGEVLRIKTTCRCNLVLEEKLRFTPDSIVKNSTREGEKNSSRGETSFLLHATNGPYSAYTRGDCNKRQFDFVEVMYATNDNDGRTTFAAAIARIMGS